jgi:ribosome biogenesis protein UTP30
MVKQSKAEKVERKSSKVTDQDDEEMLEGEVSLTIAQKKKNAKILEKATKKMFAKVKKSIELKQVVKAITALAAFAKKQKDGNLVKKLLEDEDDSVNVNFTLTQLPQNPTPRPLQIPLPHSFCAAGLTKACIFVKDPQRAFKDEIQSLKIPYLAKVIGYSKLKKNFKQYKDKRALLRQYDMFLADIRIYKMLPELLGKEFYAKKKFPCPIKVHGFEPEELQKQLNKAAKCTYFIQGNGPNYSVRVGKTSQSPKEIAENIEQALPRALAYIGAFDGIKFSKVQSVSVKIGDSPELPIFNQLQKSEISSYLQPAE